MRSDRLFGRVVYSIGFAVLVYLGVTVWGSSQGLVKAFSHFNWWLVPILLSLAFGNYLIRFVKWQYFMRVLQIEVPQRDSFVIFMSGLALSITPGKVGELIKPAFLRRGFGVPVARSSPMVFADRLTDFLALVILAAIGSAALSYGLQIVVVFGVILVAILALIEFRPLGERVISLLERNGRLRTQGHHLRILYDASRELLRPRHFAPALLLSVFAWGLEAFSFYLVFVGFGLALGPLSAIFIYSFSTIVGAISFLPGGLGATEVSLAGLMRLVGVSTGVAALATILIRLTTLWFGIIIGLYYLIRAERMFRPKEKGQD